MPNNLDLFGSPPPSHHSPVQHVSPVGLSAQERIAVLETRFDQLIIDNKDIKDKLEELVNLKHRGLGAFWLVGLIIGTGVVGFISTVLGFLNKGHL